MPVVVIAPKDAVYDKVRSNIDEVKARGGCIIGVISEDDTELEQVVEHVIRIRSVRTIIEPRPVCAGRGSVGVAEGLIAVAHRTMGCDPDYQRTASITTGTEGL